MRRKDCHGRVQRRCPICFPRDGFMPHQWWRRLEALAKWRPTKRVKYAVRRARQHKVAASDRRIEILRRVIQVRLRRANRWRYAAWEDTRTAMQRERSRLEYAAVQRPHVPVVFFGGSIEPITRTQDEWNRQRARMVRTLDTRAQQTRESILARSWALVRGFWRRGWI